MGRTTEEEPWMTEVRAPMVGKVIEVLVQQGTTVAEDEELLILESMKMEIPVPSPSSGSIHEIHVVAGDSVQEHDLLVTIG
jgi:acetyl-CoA carboxylase biotin carboxyl carrier protein